MDNLSDQGSTDEQLCHGSKVNRYPFYQHFGLSMPWLEVRVFYVRVSNYEVDESTPENLTLNHVPLLPDTMIEVNGGRNSAYLDCATLQLRRDRFDKNSEEATFVCTDSIRMNGSVRYEVFNKNDIIFSGVLELCNSNGFTGEVRDRKKWNIKCHSHASADQWLLKGKEYFGPEMLLPTVEIYVAGCFNSTPLILSKTIHFGVPQKNSRKAMLEPIPELNSTEVTKDSLVDELQLQSPEDKDHDIDHTLDGRHSNLYSARNYMEDDDGELSWFNAGVRVGVGISLGICVGVGICVGLLVSSYQATSRNIRRQLL